MNTINSEQYTKKTSSNENQLINANTLKRKLEVETTEIITFRNRSYLYDLPREIFKPIFAYSLNILNLRQTCKAFHSYIHENKDNLFELFYFPMLYYGSPEFQKKSDEILEKQTKFFLAFSNIQAMEVFMNHYLAIYNFKALNDLWQGIILCDYSNRSQVYTNSNESPHEAIQKFIDRLFLTQRAGILNTGKLTFPNLKTISLQILNSVLTIPPFKCINKLTIRNIIGNKAISTALEIHTKLKDLKSLSCGNIKLGCFRNNLLAFDSDGQDWNHCFPELELLTFKDIQYAESDEKNQMHIDYTDNDSSEEITSLLNIMHNKLKTLHFNGTIIESTIYLQYLPKLESFYLGNLDEKSYIRLSSYALNNIILNGLLDFSKRTYGEKNLKISIEKKQLFAPALNTEKWLYTINDIEKFCESLKNSQSKDLTTESIILGSYSNKTLAAHNKLVFSGKEFNDCFEKATAEHYKKTIWTFVDTLGENMHKLPNLKSISFGNLWFSLIIPASFDKLEKLSFRDIIGCVGAQQITTSLNFCGEMTNLKTLIFGNLQGAFLKKHDGNSRCFVDFQAEDLEKYFPNLIMLSFEALKALENNSLCFRHSKLERLFLNGIVSSSITLCDLPKVKEFHFEGLANSGDVYLELSSLAFKNLHLLEELIASTGRKI